MQCCTINNWRKTYCINPVTQQQNVLVDFSDHLQSRLIIIPWKWDGRNEIARVLCTQNTYQIQKVI